MGVVCVGGEGGRIYRLMIVIAHFTSFCFNILRNEHLISVEFVDSKSRIISLMKGLHLDLYHNKSDLHLIKGV